MANINIDKNVEWTAITENEFNNTIKVFNPSDLDYKFYSSVISDCDENNGFILLLKRIPIRK